MDSGYLAGFLHREFELTFHATRSNRGDDDDLIPFDFHPDDPLTRRLLAGSVSLTFGGRQREGTMEPEHEMAAPDFTVLHPELYHYTDFAGLQGITATNAIWATHFAHLNDLAEMRALRRPMADRLSIRIKHSLRKEFSSRSERRTFEANSIPEKSLRQLKTSGIDITGCICG